jgi:hypothetical protein
LTVRADHWYQDIVQPPDEFAHNASALAEQASRGIRELTSSAMLSDPPVTAWLTDEALRLPGLAQSLAQQLPERTRVIGLPADAVAKAVAHLAYRWAEGVLPRIHLDVSIPISISPQKTVRMGQSAKLGLGKEN